MSDDQPGSEPKPSGRDPWDRWGDPISEERQRELQGYLDRWAAETDHGMRIGPFDRGSRSMPHTGVLLTRDDLSWLAEQSGRLLYGYLPNLHLETLYVNPVRRTTIFTLAGCGLVG